MTQNAGAMQTGSMRWFNEGRKLKYICCAKISKCNLVGGFNPSEKY